MWAGSPFLAAGKWCQVAIRGGYGREKHARSLQRRHQRQRRLQRTQPVAAHLFVRAPPAAGCLRPPTLPSHPLLTSPGLPHAAHLLLALPRLLTTLFVHASAASAAPACSA